MKALPIRWKFALWTAALGGAVVLAFATATFFNLSAEQMEAVDLEVEAAGRHITGLTATQLTTKEPDELVQFQPWLTAAVFGENGQILQRDETLPEPIARAALTQVGLHTVHDNAGGSWRTLSLRHDGLTLALAYSLEEVRDIFQDLLIAYALSLPVVLVLAALGGWWVSGRALSPLRDFTATAEDIRADQLHRRIPAPPAQDEIRRLAEVLNAMLTRLEKSFAQSQRFAADASHELRTPLTIIGGEIGLLLRTPNLPREAEEMALSVQEEVSRLQRITEQMLLLARFDAGTVTTAHADVDLSQLVQLACEDAELLASSAGSVTVTSEIGPDIHVRGDETHLRRLVLNLLDNAIRYNEEAGRVSCTLTTHSEFVVLTVGNTGPAIPAEARPNLFQRFYRTDAARTRGGHGLGLSLCREIAHAHQGEIELSMPGKPGWTEFAVRLPVFRTS